MESVYLENFNWKPETKIERTIPTPTLQSTTEQKTNDQSSEIEKLKKEVGELKKKSTSVNPAPKQPTPTVIQKSNPQPTPVKVTPPPIETWAEKEVEELKKKPASINSAPKQSMPAKNVGARPISSASSNIKEKVPYIVQIVCPVNGGTMSGTGEIIYGSSAADNKVITNKHVLNGSVGPCGVYRTFNYENQPVLFFKSARSFIFSKNYDLAIITPDTSKLTTYTNANVEFSEDGDLLDKIIFVLGYPASAGNNITLTKGIISGTENINGMVMYKTDAKIDSGNSGGAVFDENGKFIGIPTLASQGNFASYGYIIPAKVVKNFLDVVEKEGYGKQNWQHPELSLYSVNPSNTVPDLSPRTPQNPAPQQQDNSALKIAKCQAKRDADYSTFVSKTDQMIADAVQKIMDEAKTFIDGQLRLYDACLIERPEVLKQYDSTMSPYDLCSFYLRNAEAKKTYTDQLVAQTRVSRDTFLPQGKAVVDNEYYQCVNK